MFSTHIRLTKFGPGFWCRIPGVGPGFYSFPFFQSEDTVPHKSHAINIDFSIAFWYLYVLSGILVAPK